MMLNAGITVWNGMLLDQFLSELEAHPHAFSRAAFISPFMNVGASSRTARRVAQLSSTLIRHGAVVDIVSDLTSQRASFFSTFLAKQRRFPGFAGLLPKLHSKCGYAISKTNSHLGFVGSANLTDAALTINTELVVAVKVSPALPETSNIFNQIKQQADEILSKALGPKQYQA